MGIFKNALLKLKRKKEEKEDYERQQNIMENYEERKLSPEERELNVFLKKEREEKIKKALQEFRKNEMKENWAGKKLNPLYVEDIFKDGKDMFKKNKNIFNGKATLFKQPNMFLKK